ncbi:cytochrome P450 [Gloeophyllum trabeum ATCC 11539]|uniref:Cytochrome P450 n=1 Tax=Gloeophyllum trabeum (strain ATCC 11539 / FP-39264 / Madison 617) TaxID=670483 RepID=S7QC08_GLOTA|nr:cytochrome P450 [Gloeophyllum trabeum ATCC 11539]EPQ56877.1 cytochrome P450 [Gloeophyllum trabeum ATCC 11539]
MSESSFPGAAILDIIPEVQYLPSWLPGMEFKVYAQNCVRLVTEMTTAPFEFVKSNMALGLGKRCISSELLERLPPHEGTHPLEEIIKGVAGVGYNAGADATVSAIEMVLLAMVLYPDDRMSLPYVEAVCREALRWGVVTPLSVAHATTEPDVYNGYFVPKGATIIMNTWVVHMDERVYKEAGLQRSGSTKKRVYKDPYEFKPERFLNNDGTISDEYPLTAFGLGRRICPGRHFADAAIWIVVASVLACFDISKATDENGQEIVPSVKYTDGLVRRVSRQIC